MCWFFHMTPSEWESLDDDQQAAFREFVRIQTRKAN
jgi:hypothetical protein